MTSCAQILGQVREGYENAVDPKIMALILLQWEADICHGTVEEGTLATLSARTLTNPMITDLPLSSQCIAIS